MKNIILIVIALGITLGGIYFAFFNPATIMRHAAEAEAQKLNEAFATKDRAKISAALNTLLTDDAHIKLTVEFVSLTQQGQKPMAQDFDKASFITFMDNIIYSLSDYAFGMKVENFALGADKNTAAASLPSWQWGDSTSNSFYAGITTNVRYLGATSCDGTLRFENKIPRLSGATCTLELHVTPRSGEGDALSSPEQLRDMLKQ
jgi:hypothetical protein